VATDEPRLHELSEDAIHGSQTDLLAPFQQPTIDIFRPKVTWALALAAGLQDLQNFDAG
jgi:hypothetical protein